MWCKAMTVGRSTGKRLRSFSGTMLGSSDERIIAHTEFTPVRISSDAAAEVAQDVTSALSGGARFKFEGHTWQATAAEIGAWVSTSIEQAGDTWRLRPYIDQQLSKSAMASGIRQAEGDSLSGVGFEVDDAGAVSVTTDGQGKLPDVSDAAEALSVALFGQGDTVYPAQQAPEVSVDAEDMPQRLTFQDAVDKGVVGPIGSFTTTYTTGSGTENRNHNSRAGSRYSTTHLQIRRDVVVANGTTGDCNERRGSWERAPSSMASTPIRWAVASARLPPRCSMPFTSPGFLLWNVITIRSISPAILPGGMRRSRTPILTFVWRNDTASDVLVKVSTQVGSVTATLYESIPAIR